MWEVIVRGLLSQRKIARVVGMSMDARNDCNDFKLKWMKKSLQSKCAWKTVSVETEPL